MRTEDFYLCSLLLVDEIDHELDHHLFLPRITLSDEECEGRESSIIDLYFAIFPESMTIALEELDKEKCSDTLVPIREGVILDDEVEEMGCLVNLLLKGGGSMK